VAGLGRSPCRVKRAAEKGPARPSAVPSDVGTNLSRRAGWALRPPRLTRGAGSAVSDWRSQRQGEARAKGQPGSAGLSRSSGAPGAAGATGPAGPQGPSGVQSLTPVGTSTTVSPGSFGTVTATCPAGQGPVSGGFLFAGITTASNRTTTGWLANGVNDLATPQELTVFAYCSPNITG
jgi:hypothetical protein